MNKNGEVRSASEFKSIFEETGDSYSPYRCPFCEVRYEDRCIVTECVKAPHFKLPNETTHRNGCNGEVGEDASAGVSGVPKAPRRRVVGELELPEALVKRRKASIVRKPGDDGLGAPPDAVEMARRRRLIAADKTISSCYTTTQLGPIVHGYKRAKKHAYERAVAAKLKPGSTEYNLSFRETLSAYDLSLYGHKVTYGNAFQGSKLQPWRVERVYYGSGAVRAEGDYLVIKDKDSWPKQPKSKDDHAAFEVRLARTLTPDAPTSHSRALDELEQLAAAGQGVEWYAYGLPTLLDEKFELLVDSLDDLYWAGQHQR
ncbi:hypothetical protein HI814_00135 [Ralstonia solanacearum]|nr:hypothetical protein HI814_00135 [Ralstonia solanacearum]QKM31268.1 hypothetical protein HI794_00135 [Ralstonia solanacearum]QKM36248.1 hypothetical protein HI793_00135 [Ralstonia solanacearum]